MVVRRVLDELRDARAMGWSYLLHHVRTDVTIRDVGRVQVRRGSDAEVFSQVFRRRGYDLQYVAGVREEFDRIVASGSTPLIIDLGANNGASAIWFQATYPGARIVAVEPSPANAAACRHNLAGRGIELIEAAIGSTRGSVSLVTEGRDHWDIATTRADDGNVSVITVDDIVQANADCTLFLVKVDIEGFEADLFESNTEWLDDVHVVVIEPHDWMTSGSTRTLQKSFGDLDFDILVLYENLVYTRRPRVAAP